MGLLWLPRIPRLVQPPVIETPASSFFTSQTLAPEPSELMLLATMPWASPALVTQLFSALYV